MMNLILRISLLFVLFSFTINNIYSQISKPEFGDFKHNDFDIKTCDFEDNASAIYLFEYGKSEILYKNERGNSEIVYNNENDGRYFILTRYHARIKILSDTIIDEDNFEFIMYKNSRNIERFDELRAITYNKLPNGSIGKTELDKSSIIKNDLSTDRYSYKFTMPNVKKGSIIEIKYQKTSPYIYNFEPWYFQANIPKLKSEFISIIPANFNYNLQLKGKLKFTSKDEKLLREYFKTPAGVAGAVKSTYIMNNVPSLKKGRYTTTVDNYISMIKYDLKTYNSFKGFETKYAKTWRKIDKLLLKDDRFGDQFDVKILKNEVKALVKTQTDTLELSKSIFNLVKEKIIFNGDYSLYSTKGGLKKTLKKGSGNSADVNLTLLNILLRAGINADAVALSTRDNGFVNRKHPVISEFNYVIVKVEIGGKRYLLDATRKNVPFGLLPFECYNIRGRVVKKKGSWIDLKTGDKFYENSTVSINLKDNLSFSAEVTRMYGMQSAIKFRDKLDGFNSVADYKENIKEKGGLLYDNYVVENRDIIKKDSLIKESFKLEDNLEGTIKDNRILFNPIIIGKITENPFKLEHRNYPVDYGLPTSIKTSYSISLPDGYELAKEYKPVKLLLPSNIGYYIYSLIENTDGNLLLSTRFVISKKIVSAKNYKDLKSFYNSVIYKNNALIELKPIDLSIDKN